MDPCLKSNRGAGCSHINMIGYIYINKHYNISCPLYNICISHIYIYIPYIYDSYINIIYIYSYPYPYHIPSISPSLQIRCAKNKVRCSEPSSGLGLGAVPFRIAQASAGGELRRCSNEAWDMDRDNVHCLWNV